MERKELIQIKAIGNLLNYYHSDLTYIVNFKQFKKDDDKLEDHLNRSPGSLRSFVSEYRVDRGIQATAFKEFLKSVREWVQSGLTNDVNDVDGFAERLRKEGLTHGKTMTSLASKVLFLNKPDTVIPCDRFNRIATKTTTKSYADFKGKIDEFMWVAVPWIDATLEPIKEYLQTIESDFSQELAYIEMDKVRRNRFLDKVLWVSGQSAMTMDIRQGSLEFLNAARGRRNVYPSRN
jgi:hypothetical protein